MASDSCHIRRQSRHQRDESTSPPRDAEDGRQVARRSREHGSAPSHAGRTIGNAATRLDQWIESQGASRRSCSGFRLLSAGLDAFVARGALIELADRTLDLQYYIFHADNAGAVVVDRLLAAADRGVRVRLLLDDWGTLDKSDEAVAALDAHDNIEIRLFNPYRHRSGARKFAELLTGFARINRRMHNKQLIADGHAVVLGGRNIGDEYFELGNVDFQDLDVLACGPLARQSEESFEAYWKSDLAVPIRSLARTSLSAGSADELRRRVRHRVKTLACSPYIESLREAPLARALRAHELQLTWAESRLLADPPEKLKTPAGTSDDMFLGARLAPHVRAVREELLIVSPYFVPGTRGVGFFGDKARAGVAVRILTNSLAATDVWLVHAGYRKYRRALLERGVSLFELTPQAQGDAGVNGLVGSSHASLHGKTVVLDRRSVFIGSVNIDPRSLEQNTEVGVLVESPALAREVAALFESWTAPERSYELALSRSNDGVVWRSTRDGQPAEYGVEPDVGMARRLGARIFSLLPIEPFI